MVDNITAWRYITRDEAKIVEQHLQFKKSWANKDGVDVTHGCIDNMHILILPNTIKAFGSLPKFLFDGSNHLYGLDLNSAYDAVTKLSATIGLDMSDAWISKMEIGITLTGLKYPTEEYLYRFGASAGSRFPRQPSNYVYYKNKCRELKIYDKIKENSHSHKPAQFKETNALRIELTLNKYVARQLHCDKVTMHNLWDSSFWALMKMKFKETYDSIPKIQNLNVATKGLTARKAVDALLAMAVRNIGQANIAQFNAQLQHSDAFTTRTERSRYMKSFAELMGFRDAYSDEVITELDTAVINALSSMGL